MIGKRSPVFIGSIFFIKCLPTVIGPFGYAEPFAGGTESGAVFDRFVNKLDCFTAI